MKTKYCQKLICIFLTFKEKLYRTYSTYMMNYHSDVPRARENMSSAERPLHYSSKPMSSDVIKEAKLWTERASVNTRRPSTPKDALRELFGKRRGSSSRPPSAISIGHFDPSDPESRPGSAASKKLAPLSKPPTVPANAEPAISKVHLPMPPNINDLSVRNTFRNLPGTGKSPIKAFHPKHYESEHGTSTHPTPPSRNFHSAGERPTNISFDNSIKPSPPPKMKTRDKSHSASLISINLTQLCGNSENETQNSASSSSSASSIEQQNIMQRKRSGGGSGQGAGEETPEQAKYWNLNILPLLEVLEDTSQSREIAYDVCVQLNEALEKGDCSKNMMPRRRASLLTTLFKQLNNTTTPVHLACARIILALKVRRQNLNSVCKMLFKISREKKFDGKFVENNLLEGMLNIMTNFTDPLDNYETLVYLTGTMKFLSDNKTVASELAVKGCITSFVTLLKNTLQSLQARSQQKKEKLHATDILIQVTAVLRSMADLDKHAFTGSDLFPQLFEALDVLVADETLTLNISRLLSKLTMYSELHKEFFESKTWSSSLFNALTIHKNCANIVVRICFALGNVTSKEEQARIIIHTMKLPIDSTYLSVINSVLAHYLSMFFENRSENNEKSQESSEKFLDTVNKIVRVIANLSISEQPGMEIASDGQCIDNILTILQEIKVSDSEELIINTLTTLNNLSYYSYSDNAVSKSRIKITNLLINILLGDSMACVMEATRVFGNISQHADVRTVLHSHRVDVMMVALLDSSTWQMVYSASGVLINMTAIQANRACLLEEGIISKLIDVLKDFAPVEWRVGGVACQLLWNLCECIQSASNSILSSDAADTLLEVLHTYLQKDAPFQILDTSDWEDDIKNYVSWNWRNEFCPVALRLYKKLSAHHSQLVPLETQ